MNPREVNPGLWERAYLAAITGAAGTGLQDNDTYNSPLDHPEVVVAEMVCELAWAIADRTVVDDDRDHGWIQDKDGWRATKKEAP